jgi:hypothetical protein
MKKLTIETANNAYFITTAEVYNRNLPKATLGSLAA